MTDTRALKMILASAAMAGFMASSPAAQATPKLAQPDRETIEKHRQFENCLLEKEKTAAPAREKAWATANTIVESRVLASEQATRQAAGQAGLSAEDTETLLQDLASAERARAQAFLTANIEHSPRACEAELHYYALGESGNILDLHSKYGREAVLQWIFPKGRDAQGAHIWEPLP